VTFGLAELGMAVGERVRFRSPDKGRWQAGKVTGRERDGSLGVVDGKGSARAIPLDNVLVSCTGPRGAAMWEPLLDRAARTEQLKLL
jgi:hypothetical protein